MHLSSPFRAFSNASGNSDLSKSYVIEGDPRQRVDNKLIIVDTLAVFFPSAGVLDADETPEAPIALDAGVPPAEFIPELPNELDILARRSRTRPCSAKGAGSTPRRVKRSDNEAKQRRAPSAT
jgi:hypothetical protein